MTKKQWVYIIISILAFFLFMSDFVSSAVDDSIKIEYLYINKALVPDTQKELTLFKELLSGGRLSIAGKVNKEVQIKQIEISINGKKTWRKIKALDDNSFRVSFTPKDISRYDLYIRITDEKGNTNNTDATYKIIKFYDKPLKDMVRETIDGLIDSYQMKSPGRFMSYVDDSYTGDKMTLDTAIRRDFSQIHDISIQYTLNSIVPDYKDKVSVSLHFVRSYTDIKTGQRKVDEGMGSLIFNIGAGGLKLYSMRDKPLFGFK